MRNTQKMYLFEREKKTQKMCLFKKKKKKKKRGEKRMSPQKK